MPHEAPKPYNLMTVRSVLALRPPLMQVENFLISGSVTGITAFGGVGKTWFALELMRAVSSPADPFLGNPEFKSRYGGVLYVGKDSSIYDYARQWRRLTKDRSASFAGVRFLSDEEDFSFDSAEDWERLFATHEQFEFGEVEIDDEGDEVRDRGFALVIFDTMSAMTAAEQNSNTDIARVFANVRKYAALTGSTCVILHHNARRSEFNDGTEWRGATAGFNSLDAHLNLTRGKKDKAVISVEWKKFRGITPPPFSYRMHVTDPKVARLEYLGQFDQPSQAVNGTDPLGATLHLTITNNPGLRQREYANLLWERFHVGEGGLQFNDEKKFRVAVANRIAALIAGHMIVRDPTSSVARPTYLPVVKEEAQ